MLRRTFRISGRTFTPLRTGFRFSVLVSFHSGQSLHETCLPSKKIILLQVQVEGIWMVSKGNFYNLSDMVRKRVSEVIDEYSKFYFRFALATGYSPEETRQGGGREN